MDLSNLNIAFDVPSFLTGLVLIGGIITLLDIFIFSKKRPPGKKMPLWIEYARSFFPMFLLVLCIRSFLIQPYKVPTGSLVPTVLPGDFIVVNQFAYGLRLPVLNTKIIDIGNPKRGDITLFRYPGDINILYVKRVIGLPGDHVVYNNKVLTINGDVISQTPLGIDLDLSDDFATPVQVRMEHLYGVDHKVFIKPGYKEWEEIDVIVPPKFYFVMGDNRDNSLDSREWGFVPEANLIGKAFGIWMSWDPIKHWPRWNRIAKSLY